MKFALLILLGLAIAACASHINAPASTTSLSATEYTVLPKQVYTPADWPEALEADIYMPSSAGPFPAVLVVHGGGWEGRSRDDMERISRRLASSGFVAVNISYRFAPQHRFPAQLHDLQVAMHWMHDNADGFKIDSDRIGALGYSAGAHLVSLLGLVAGQGGELDEPYGGQKTRPAAIVAGGTPSDLRKFTGGTLVPQFLGGRLTEIPQTFAQASPVTHVHAKAPAFFLFHGNSDRLVSPDHATDFHEKLQAADIESELYLMSLRGHVATFLTSRNAIGAGMEFLQRQLNADKNHTAATN